MYLIEALKRYIGESLSSSEAYIVSFADWFEKGEEATDISTSDIEMWFDEWLGWQGNPKAEIVSSDEGVGLTQLGSQWSRDVDIQIRAEDAQPIELVFPLEVPEEALPEQLTTTYRPGNNIDWDELSLSTGRRMQHLYNATVTVTWTLKGYFPINSSDLNSQWVARYEF